MKTRIENVQVESDLVRKLHRYSEVKEIVIDAAEGSAYAVIDHVDLDGLIEEVKWMHYNRTGSAFEERLCDRFGMGRRLAKEAEEETPIASSGGGPKSPATKKRHRGK